MTVTVGLCARRKFTYGCVKMFKGKWTCATHVLGAQSLKESVEIKTNHN